MSNKTTQPMTFRPGAELRQQMKLAVAALPALSTEADLMRVAVSEYIERQAPAIEAVRAEYDAAQAALEALAQAAREAA